MATYFISDIHGEYDLFCKLLEKIDFQNKDRMIVLGDFLDKGRQPIKLAKLILSMPNIEAICGNHEALFIRYYQSQMRDFNDGDGIGGVLEKLQNYFYEEAEKLTWDIVDYIEALPRYIETSDFICVHAGVGLSDAAEILPMCGQEPNMLIFDRQLACDYIIPKNSKTVLFGHTPCHYQNGTGEIIKTPRPGCGFLSNRIGDFAKIQLDNGVSYTKMLGALRLEDMREFYVKGQGIDN